MIQLISIAQFDHTANPTRIYARVDRPHPSQPLSRVEVFRIFYRLAGRQSFVFDPTDHKIIWSWPLITWHPYQLPPAHATAQLQRLSPDTTWLNAPSYDLTPPITHGDQVCPDGVIRMLPDTAMVTPAARARRPGVTTHTRKEQHDRPTRPGNPLRRLPRRSR